METDISKYLEFLKEHLTEEKYIHSIGVMKQAVELARMFKLDEEKAKIAGLLHDCAKCFSREKLQEILHTHLNHVNTCELKNHKTLHAPVGAWVAKETFNIEDLEILSSIRNHTLGSIDMTDFDKIIFIADKIEPETRNEKFRNCVLDELKQPNGLNKALLMCVKSSLSHLMKKNLKICSQSIELYNFLVDEL